MAVSGGGGPLAGSDMEEVVAMKGWKIGGGCAVLASTLAAGRGRAAAGRSTRTPAGARSRCCPTCVYMPAKLVYAALGGLTGGLALGLTGGDMQTAENVWRAVAGRHVRRHAEHAAGRGSDRVRRVGSGADTAADAAAGRPGEPTRAWPPEQNRGNS